MSTYASVAAGGRGDGGGAVVANTAVSGRKDDPTPNNPTSELILSFRQKANFMKHWKPASTPSVSARSRSYARTHARMLIPFCLLLVFRNFDRFEKESRSTRIVCVA
jgi:hypothetical protein